MNKVRKHSIIGNRHVIVKVRHHCINEMTLHSDGVSLLWLINMQSSSQRAIIIPSLSFVLYSDAQPRFTRQGRIRSPLVAKLPCAATRWTPGC